MEKKINRSVQPSSTKGSVTEKKGSDVNNSKAFPRGNIRREPNGGSFSTKNETNRKPIPQRFRNFDKRPRPRGVYGNVSAVAGNEEARLEEIENPELGSVFVQGSKKQSLNHLLNFQYVPYKRQYYSDNNINNTQLNKKRLIVTSKHKYNKEEFLQANCQFVVKGWKESYDEYIRNPDKLVNWDLIEQVNLQVSEFPSCPICLYPPVAAKITQCGHIYCWSCMLHYLSVCVERKCPICFEKLKNFELKSVIVIPHNSFNVNDEITFKLMKRARGSLIAYPADQEIDNDKFLFNMSDASTSNVYCKLLLATLEDVEIIIDRESVELKNQLTQDENTPEKHFIETAINILSEKREKLKLEEMDYCISKIVDVDNAQKQKFFSTSTSSRKQPTKIFYFYQASDGQHIYLHPLNIRMLEHTYGSLESCPLSVSGKITEKEGGSMTEDIRKRLRYLEHLPLTCQFEIAEITLNNTVVSKETLEEFHDQIEIRKKRRIKYAKEEKRREKRIAEMENRVMGKYPDANIQIDSHNQFPEFDGTGFESTLSSSAEAASTSNTNPSPNSSTVGSLDSDYCTMSFAKMLISPSQKKQAPEWPQLAKKQEEPKLINVTGSKSNSKLIKIGKSRETDSESEGENYVSVPEYNRSFRDSIAAALDSVTSPQGEGTKDDTNKNNNRRNKKKNKQKLLFATSMTCGKH